MANDEDDSSTREQWARYLLIGFLVVGLVWGVWYYLSRPPQMGASEEVFKTVDALYTAIRNHDEKRIADCEQRIKGFRANNQLPADAADFLEGIIAKSRSGSWDQATRSLYDFMVVQRRDGPVESAKTAPK